MTRQPVMLTPAEADYLIGCTLTYDVTRFIKLGYKRAFDAEGVLVRLQNARNSHHVNTDEAPDVDLHAEAMRSRESF